MADSQRVHEVQVRRRGSDVIGVEDHDVVQRAHQRPTFHGPAIARQYLSRDGEHDGVRASRAEGVLDTLRARRRRAQDINFSPPGTMPFGLGLGAVTLGDQLQRTLRHRWKLWSSSACAEFADVFLDELAGLTAP